MLCARCSDILSGEVLPPQDPDGRFNHYPADHPHWNAHYPSLADVHGHSDEGCRLCHELWVRAEKEGLAEDTQYSYRIEQRMKEPLPSSQTRDMIPAAWITFKMKPISTAKRGYVFGLWMIDEPTNPRCSYVPAAYSGDESMFQLLESWISECSRDHQGNGCVVANPNNWRPTRLINLVSPSTARVIETKEVRFTSQTPYISLSHCWGQHRPTTLVAANESELKGGFDVSILPQTFRDALQVTWRLGVRYIWIDSLCILQDSAEDWRREAAMMGDVYRFAYLNLGATRASDSTQGMFNTRNPAWLEVPRGKIQFEGYESLSCLFGDEWTIYRPFVEGPLMPRAWVLQERLLAPRMVHFGERQVHWQCRGGWSTEMHTSATALQNGFHNIHVNEQSEIFNALFKEREDSEASKEMVLNAWSHTISEYAKLDLTFATDKLIALSGIVFHFAKLRPENDQYLAGLWKSELPASLLWFSQMRSKRSKTYQAPSWSWASLDAEDMNDVPLVRNNCSTLISASVSLVDEASPFGQVTGGQITIDALVPTMKLLSQSYAGEFTGHRRYICIMEEVDLEFYCHDIPNYDTHEAGMKFALGRLHWDDELLPCAMLDVAFIVGSIREEQMDFGCLLLEKKGEVYRRIGCMRFAVKKEKGEAALAQKNLWQTITIV